MFIRENPIQMDDLGVPPIYGNLHIVEKKHGVISRNNPGVSWECVGNNMGTMWKSYGHIIGTYGKSFGFVV